MKHVYNDGGRAAAGFKGSADDCVCRAIALAAELPYRAVYETIADGHATQRAGKRGKRARSARNGTSTQRKWFRDYMASLDFRWVPTMQIGSGCTVHLHDGELPMGRLIVSLSRHYTAVINGVVHDTYDPQRTTLITENGAQRIARRCVYGYWIK